MESIKLERKIFLQEITLIATTTFGLEAVVKNEINELGYEIVNVRNGRVEFKGDLEAICQANLWLRCAERVLVKIGEFAAEDFDQLYEKTRQLPWQKWLPVNANFPVSGKSVSSKLHNVPSCQSIVKKAVVDKLKEHYLKNWFKENGPRFKIEVGLLKDRATLTLDSSGSGLHKRGYRTLNTGAPLQETIAAAMIYLSRWNYDRILIDPFCGSGTIPIEAALMAKNIAPGLEREFDSEDWPIISQKTWQLARKKARAAIKDELEPRLIMGFDKDEEVISIARFHARKAAVLDEIHLQGKDFADFETSRKYGYIITNPPYGERLGQSKEVEKLYREMGRKFTALQTWSYYILSSHSDFEGIFGKEASKRRKLYNGGIECQYYQYYGPRPPAN